MKDQNLTHDGGSHILVPDPVETLVPDARAGLRPSQMIDRKLASMRENAQPTNPREGYDHSEGESGGRMPSSRETFG